MVQISQEKSNQAQPNLLTQNSKRGMPNKRDNLINSIIRVDLIKKNSDVP